MNKCDISKTIERRTRYIFNKFSLLELLYVKKPITDNKLKAYKWFVETKKSLVS